MVFQEEAGHKGGPDDEEAVHWIEACKDSSETQASKRLVTCMQLQKQGVNLLLANQTREDLNLAD